MPIFANNRRNIKKMSSHFCKNTQKKSKKLFKIGFFAIERKGLVMGKYPTGYGYRHSGI